MNYTKIAINGGLIALSLLVAYLLYDSVRIPIDFKNTWESRETKVREKLVEIAELQKMYKTLRKTYAPSFDSLKYVLTNDTFEVEVKTGDKYEEGTIQKIVIVKYPAADSLKNFLKKSVTGKTNVDEYFKEIAAIPFSNGKEFKVEKDSAEVSGGVGGAVIQIPTFEVSARYRDYLPEYDSSYMMYNTQFNPIELRKVGDLYKPSTSGNW
jgi:hypothetical protein